jgi:hypothetical protein
MGARRDRKCNGMVWRVYGMDGEHFSVLLHHLIHRGVKNLGPIDGAKGIHLKKLLLSKRRKKFEPHSGSLWDN